MSEKMVNSQLIDIIQKVETIRSVTGAKKIVDDLSDLKTNELRNFLNSSVNNTALEQTEVHTSVSTIEDEIDLIITNAVVKEPKAFADTLRLRAAFNSVFNNDGFGIKPRIRPTSGDDFEKLAKSLNVPLGRN